MLITLQWSNAQYAPGVRGLVLAGGRPARVPDRVIDNIRRRERGGFVELPKKPQPRRGDAMRVVQGPFRFARRIYAGQASRDRITVLLSLLGGQQRVDLPAAHVEPVAS